MSDMSEEVYELENLTVLILCSSSFSGFLPKIKQLKKIEKNEKNGVLRHGKRLLSPARNRRIERHFN
jgi:hypothetical protein